MGDGIIEKGKEKFKLWFKDPYNLLLILIIISAFFIRLYFFNITQNQPLWWDEAEYMLKAKNIAFGTPESGWFSLRPIFFPLIAAVFFKLGFSEVLFRLLWIILSLAGIFMVYFIGQTIYNKIIGLTAAAMFSVFYLDLFYSTRLLVQTPEIFFVLLGASFFVKYYFGNGPKKLILFIIPIIFFGALIRFTVGLFLFILLVFLLATEKLNLFKEKKWYISSIIGLLIFSPYLIYSQISYGNPFHAFIGVAASGSDRSPEDTPFNVFMQYITYFPNYFSLVFFIFFLLGLAITLFSLFLMYDRITKNPSAKKDFFIILWLIIVITYFGFFINHFEDRYIFIAFPAVFLIAGKGLNYFYEFIKKYNKNIAVALIFVLILYGSWIDFKRTDSLIKAKVDSYAPVKEAGIWIMEHSSNEDKVVSMSRPQNTYYSERFTYTIPKNETDLEKLINEEKPRFLVVSIFEPHPPWINDWLQKNQNITKPVQAYYADEKRTKLVLVIFEFQY